MSKLVTLLLAGLCAAACNMSAAAKTETVTGQVVDLVCYARNNANTGLDHEDARVCAIACVKWEGNPVGIVATDGKVYQFEGGLTANNNAKIAAHLAHTVIVTGDVSEKDGMLMLSSNDVTMVKK